MRLLVILCALGMALLAAFFLRGRRLTFYGYLGWGLLALLLPILGPFLVILARPGMPLRRSPRRRLASRRMPVALVFHRARDGLRRLFQS